MGMNLEPGGAPPPDLLPQERPLGESMSSINYSNNTHIHYNFNTI
jgi:hypothetical protein